MRTQYYNTRRNHLMEYNGEVKTVAEWSEYAGIPYNTMLARVTRYGWTAEKAITTPVRQITRKGNGD